ncbi:tRNA (guanine(46)-N(7))-methyltransferase TrmB [Halomonas llamarensis]|uniref:tRNA (guanine(46)-N(7))-methyltransferase n=1 Tax=Halomonas llamarensis TaxID=2945104 RepID=A0ABT0SL58_9GAMM|nr:SAM-dependent methyltransferase [Halomonas llamarensis]MCL7928533.1 SAM-dependent methyltransferase [Halomonas llamarensis]
MQTRSRAVESNQPGAHPDVSRRVSRALAHPWQKPIAAHTQKAFETANAWLGERCAPLILDAGCGVGLSTRRLAATFPDHAVIGVDRSADRLGRDHGAPPENALLVRADLVDFWRLAQRAGWTPLRHYLLYPNPYPKAAHLNRRWHGHPVFPTLLALGGRLELRSNWKIYVEEFAQAVVQATGKSPDITAHYPSGDYLTPFEAKYDHSGQALWRLIVNLERV